MLTPSQLSRYKMCIEYQEIISHVKRKCTNANGQPDQKCFLRLNVSAALIVDAIIVDMSWETMQVKIKLSLIREVKRKNQSQGFLFVCGFNF